MDAGCRLLKVVGRFGPPIDEKGIRNRQILNKDDNKNCCRINRRFIYLLVKDLLVVCHRFSLLLFLDIADTH